MARYVYNVTLILRYVYFSITRPLLLTFWDWPTSVRPPSWILAPSFSSSDRQRAPKRRQIKPTHKAEHLRAVGGFNLSLSRLHIYPLFIPLYLSYTLTGEKREIKGKTAKASQGVRAVCLDKARWVQNRCFAHCSTWDKLRAQNTSKIWTLLPLSLTLPPALLFHFRVGYFPNLNLDFY